MSPFLFGAFESVQDDFSTNYTPLEALECCTASSAKCNACKQGMSEEAYCEKNPSALGCEPEPDAQQSMFDQDGWTPHASLYRSTNASEVEAKQAMRSATTEQELKIAITEAKAANVNHRIIQQQQSRLEEMQGAETTDSYSARLSSESLTSSQGTHTSHTGQKCKRSGKLDKKACEAGYRNVRRYCKETDDPLCEKYEDRHEHTNSYYLLQAMRSATTEQELEIAITEAKAANVSHIIIQKQQSRLDEMRGADKSEPEPEPEPEPDLIYVLIGIGAALSLAVVVYSR